MGLVIFAFGVVVFLITVNGTVAPGGELLSGRRLDEQPELMPETARPQSANASIARARALVRWGF